MPKSEALAGGHNPNTEPEIGEFVMGEGFSPASLNLRRMTQTPRPEDQSTTTELWTDHETIDFLTLKHFETL